MSTTSRAPEGRATRRGASAGTLLLAFLLGVVITAAAAVALLGLGVATVGDAAHAEATTPVPTPAATPTERTASGSPVPQACLDAAVYNETFTAALDEVAVGVRDQDARRLQEALDAVQDAKPGSEEASRTCRDLAEQSGTASTATEEPTTAAEPGATDEPTGTPGPTTTPVP